MVSENRSHDKPIFASNSSDSQPKSSNGHGDDEPPWSPSLIDMIAQAEQVWLCYDRDDAELLLRPDVGDVPALWLPLQQIRLLTPELVTPLTKIFVLQRSDDSLGDGFYAGYGLKVAQQLATVGWGGTLYRIPLNEVIPTLPRLWSFVQEDRHRFQVELVHLQMAGISEAIKPTRRAKQAKPFKPPGPRPLIVHAHEVQEQAIQWLWPPYLPRGMVVTLDGDPGLGKSMMLLQVATNLSRGLPFLDQLGKPTLLPEVDGPQTVLILSAEDSIEHVMVPRLKRAGADLERIKFLTGWLGAEDQAHAFNLQHLSVLVNAVEALQPVLVVLDPLVAYLGDIDMHRSNHTRPLMAALKQLAECAQCTIVCVRHPAKLDLGGRLMYRGQGNIDIIGAARSGLWVQPHPTHPETQTLLIHAKTNVGMPGRTVIFSREQGQFAWVGVSRLTESMLTGRGPDPHAMIEAFFWLEETMTPGIPYRSAALEADAEKKDISLKVLKRAKKFLGVKSFQREDGWYCFLPSLTTTTTTTTTGVSGATGTTGSTGYSDLKSMTYDDPQAEDQQPPAPPVDPRIPSSPSHNTRAREEEQTR